MKKLLTIFLTFILIVTSAVCMVGCSNTNTDGVDDAPSTEAGNVIQNSNIYSISLFSSPVTQSEDYVAKTITAVITPADAINKAVDWNVLWINNLEGEDAVVTDYVTVTPTSDGALTAEVRCYKAFEGSTIGVQVVTRVGKISAMCNVTYIGEPSSMQIVQNDVTATYDETWGKDIIDLEVGQTYNFDLTLDNIFNNVTENFVPNYAFKVECYGVINTEVISSSSTAQKGLSLISEGSAVYLDDGGGSPVIDFLGEETWFLSYSLSDDKVKIKADISMLSFNLVCSSVLPSMGAVYYKSLSFVDNKPPYVEITITETNTNVSQKIAVRTTSAIESVAVDGDLTF